ncbi:MAG: hypothetical protein FWE55_03870 [Synergistaceae bacterium]|nr:hypothetical protein [Synergistaceae bacterium]
MFRNGITKIILLTAVILACALSSPSLAATNTAEYQILATTAGGIQGMSAPFTMQLDARGTPVKGNPEEASHFIPPGMNMGNALPLLRPDSPQSAPGNAGAAGTRDTAEENWTYKIYWGCSKEVQKGQPIVISTQDMKSGKGKFAELADVSQGVLKGAPPKGWGWGQWPNKKSSIPVPRGASLKGDHRVEGNYLPQIKFNISNHDFLPTLDVKIGGSDLAASLPLTWAPVKGAVGYFAHAMASSQEKRETVIWTSSAKPTMGIMMMHEHSSRIKELVKSGIAMGSDKTACNIPAGIFVGYENAMVSASAWGEDYWMSYPEKPAKAPKNWVPDWTVNALFLASWMGMPGMDIPVMSDTNFETPVDTGGDDVQEQQSTPSRRGGGLKIGVPLPIPLPGF